MRSASRLWRALVPLVVALLLVSTGYVQPASAATITIVVGQTNGGTTTGVNQYNSASVSGTAGDTVTWNSANDARSHTVTSFSEAVAGTPDWDSGNMRSGTALTTFSRVFAAAGTYTYYCAFHATRAQADPAVVDANIAAGVMVGKIVMAAPVPDTTAPAVSAVAAAPNPTNGASGVTLSATVTDSGTPLGTIAAAEYSIGAAAAAAGTGTAMSATDGAFNAATEGVSATVSVASYAAGTSITLWVRGRDAAGNWSLAGSTLLSITAVPAGSVQATVTIGAGNLSNTSGASIPFGSVALTGADANLPFAPTTPWRAMDARGTGAGWNITVSATDFTSALGGIAVANFKVQLLAAKIVRIAGNTSPTSGATTYQPLGATPLKLLSAAAGQGMGTYDYTPDFQLTVPAQTLAGTYQSVVTVSVNTGP